MFTIKRGICTNKGITLNSFMPFLEYSQVSAPTGSALVLCIDIKLEWAVLVAHFAVVSFLINSTAQHSPNSISKCRRHIKDG